MFAKNASPKVKTITKVNHTLFREVIKTLDIDSVVYPKFTTAHTILTSVRAKQNDDERSEVTQLTRIINNKVEAIEFEVSEDCRLIGKTLTELRIRKNILLGSITRGDKVIIPKGSDSLQVGDTVVLVTTTERLSALDDILE